MALSQKHTGKILVPWFCSAEWRFVSDKIYGKNSNVTTQQEALDIINIWKARTPMLPCGVEGTFMILEALLIDRNNYKDYAMRLLLSTSVMRFLNICSAFDKHQTTFYQVARKMKLPEWLINLRHDTAHGQNLPSLDILFRALNFCLGWLYREYWKPVSANLKDFVDSIEFQNERYALLKMNLAPLVSSYCYINLLSHPNWDYKIVRNIADADAKNSLIRELKSLRNVQTINDYTKIPTMLHILWQNIKAILKDFEDVNLKNSAIIELLLEDDVFLGSFEDNEAVFKGATKNKMPLNFLCLWESLLTDIHSTGNLGKLIEHLLNFLNIQDETHDRKHMAALWILEIAKGLSKCALAQEIFKDIEKEEHVDIQSVVLKEKLKDLCYQKNKNMKEYLCLSLLSEIPEIFTDCLKFKTYILDSPNEYTNIFIAQLLNLNEILKISPHKKQILDLVNIYLIKNKQSPESLSEKIYTIKDISDDTMEVAEPTPKKQKLNEDIEENLTVDHSNNNETIIKRFRKVTGVDFGKCPIGVLPWQQVTVNPLLN